MNIEIQDSRKLIRCESREDWLAARRIGIGASDAAALLGESPWKSRYALWHEKRGNVDDATEETEPMYWGTKLEQPIREALAERSGLVVLPWPQHTIAVHHEHDWALCTPDGLVGEAFSDDAELGNCQIKTASAYTAQEFCEEFPLQYQIQTQWELAVLGRSWGILAVLIGGQQLKWYRYERNEPFIEAMLREAEVFWRSVERGLEPELDNSESSQRVVKRLYRGGNGKEIDLPDEALHWTEQYDALGRIVKDAEAERQALQSKLQAAIGANSFGRLSDGSRWKLGEVEVKEHEVKASTYTRLWRLKK